MRGSLAVQRVPGCLFVQVQTAQAKGAREAFRQSNVLRCGDPRQLKGSRVPAPKRPFREELPEQSQLPARPVPQRGTGKSR